MFRKSGFTRTCPLINQEKRRQDRCQTGRSGVSRNEKILFMAVDTLTAECNCNCAGHLVHRFGITERDWHRIKLNIDSKCRTAFRRKIRGQPLTVKAFRGKAASTYVHLGQPLHVDSDEDTKSMHGTADSVLQINEVCSAAMAWSFSLKVHGTRGQSNLTKSASWGAHSPVRGHPRGLKCVPLNSWGRVSY